MENRKLWLGILVMVLVFGMAVIGCNNNPEDESDTWSNVTSLSQLNGTWKGSYSETEIVEGITISTTAEMTIIINSSAGTRSSSTKMIMEFSGDGISLVWPYIKEEFDEPGVTFNDANHSLTWTENIPTESISLSEMGDVKINQNGTKIKVPADDADGTPEIIFVKQ
jgi:hypothetical protein